MCNTLVLRPGDATLDRAVINSLMKPSRNSDRETFYCSHPLSEVTVKFVECAISCNFVPCGKHPAGGPAPGKELFRRWKAKIRSIKFSRRRASWSLPSSSIGKFGRACRSIAANTRSHFDRAFLFVTHLDTRLSHNWENLFSVHTPINQVHGVHVRVDGKCFHCFGMVQA
ncbi:MAG: hypothetical protein CM1200mP18_05740 [Gammaproteobacteria bacterium]|nr:MAG: hypothetical protein CM1200mP18_05740 [Gammaproteobacteria bacterium]